MRDGPRTLRPRLSLLEQVDVAQTRLARIAVDIATRRPCQANVERNIDDLRRFERLIHEMTRAELARLGR